MRTQDFEADGGCGGGSISVQHPQRVPLGGLPVIWHSRRVRALSTNTRGSLKIFGFVCRHQVG